MLFCKIWKINDIVQTEQQIVATVHRTAFGLGLGLGLGLLTFSQPLGWIADS